MPNLEPVVLEGRTYQLRHVGPQSTIWPNPSIKVATYALLNQSAMVARPLPWSNNPNSADWVQGQWTGRLDDAADFSITFPNKEASDGQPWRNRFDPSGKNQWIEIWNDGYLEGSHCIEKVDFKRDSVVTSGHDGWWQLKSAYERDWVVVQAPRDVVERGTQVWALGVADDFSPGVLSAQWTSSITGAGATIGIGTNGGLRMFAPAVTGTYITTITATVAVNATGTWRAAVDAQYTNIPTGSDFYLQVTENNNAQPYSLFLYGSKAVFHASVGGGPDVGQIVPPASPTYGLVIESDGEWVSAYCNGQQIGQTRRLNLSGATSISVQVGLVSVQGGSPLATTAVVQSCVLETMQPFLMAGTDKGDYVLPGNATTYPNGGLHARYFNNLDLQGDALRLNKIHGPVRTQVFAGSSAAEYINQQDATINGQQNPLPGAATSRWSAIWFGAIWLALSAGDYKFKANLPSGANAVRIWVGKTIFGTQLVERWDFGTSNLIRNPATGIDSDAVGTIAWSNPGSLGAGAGTAQAVSALTGTTHYLDESNYGFAIPLGATVQGIQLAIKRYGEGPTPTVVDSEVKLVKAGVIQPTNKASGSNWPLHAAGVATATYGGSTDLWGTTWTPADINNSEFGVVLSATQSSASQANVVAMTITIFLSYDFTVSAAALAGALPYGSGTIQRDGWYPIKVEYAVDTPTAVGPTLTLTNSPASYTDPGGTAITSGAQTTVVPATSLSPLGCVDQRYQGISHFDMVQQTGHAVGYQLSCEPYQLETLGLANQPGRFPGVLAPRIREGRDTDAILVPDLSPRTDGEGLVDYGNTLDATDTCAELSGNGAGFQNGATGQLQTFVFDPSTLVTSLFNTQAWQDFSDASFASLLTALLNSELGLRLAPWQIVTGQPMGRPRLANTWPLPSTLAQSRWRPGDGLRVQARDVNIFDLSPRQLLVVTRAIHPNGATSTQANFAARPRTEGRTLKQQLFSVSRLQRNNQGQPVTLTTDLSLFIGIAAIAPAGFTAYFGVGLLPGDQIVSAQVRFAYNDGTVGLEVNTVDQTTALNGPWIGAPINIDITSLAAPITSVSGSRIFCRGINKGAGNAVIQPQLIIRLLR